MDLMRTVAGRLRSRAQRRVALSKPNRDPALEKRAAALADLTSLDPDVTSPAEALQYGVLLAEAGHPDRAAEVFDLLILVADDEESRGVARHSLASAYEDLGWYNSSAHQLLRVIEDAPTPELKRSCSAQLAQLSEIRNQADADLRLGELQLACCLERIANGDDDDDQLRLLGRLAQRAVDADPAIALTAAAAARLETAFGEDPESTDVLRGLLHCRLVQGDGRGASETLAALDELQPDAPDLVAVATRLAAGVVAPPGPRFAAFLPRLLEILEEDTSGPGDDRRRTAAMSDLRAAVARWPHDTSCSFALAFGLLVTGELRQLRDVIGRIERLERQEHAFHHNLARLLMAVGEADRARSHAHLALVLALTEDDRADAAALTERIGPPDVCP